MKVSVTGICASGLVAGKDALRPKALPVTEAFNGGPDDMHGMSKRFGEHLAAPARAGRAATE